ncbi:MAG: hypothetical protein ABSD38_20990 [Syntrophorhabdales bacterium]|jgi:DNA-directed RNA polymerase specialized sigma24 family protein
MITNLVLSQRQKLLRDVRGLIGAARIHEANGLDIGSKFYQDIHIAEFAARDMVLYRLAEIHAYKMKRDRVAYVLQNMTYTYREIADIMGISTRGVWMYIAPKTGSADRSPVSQLDRDYVRVNYLKRGN